MNSAVIELNDDNFSTEVYGSESPVLVEFCSESSYACRELSDIIDSLSAEYAGRVRIGRLDIDAHWQTADQLEVRTTPAVLLIQNDRIVERIDGPKTMREYRQALNELVAQYWVI